MPFGDELTAAQKRALQRSNSLILENEGVEKQAFTCYHDPRTGQEFPRLPMDSYSLANYINRGLMPGRAPAELREGWIAGQAERAAECDARRRKAERDPEFAKLKEQTESVPAAEVAGIAKQAAQAAVAEVLRQLGIDASALPAAVTEQPGTEAAGAPETEPKQLRML